jgi:HlyD family secretion protein
MTAPLSPDEARALVPRLWHDDAPRVAPPYALRRLLLATTGLLVVLFVLAATVPIGGAVIGAGQVMTQSRVKRVAHPTGGVIGEVLVHNGDHVRAGQVLLRLDDRVTGADARLADLTVEQLLAQRARAEAERFGLSTIAFPPELTRVGTPDAARAMADERHLFALHQTEERGMKAQLFARVMQDNAEIHGFDAQIAALHEQRRLIERERQGVRDLWDKQLVTISRMNQLDRTAVDLDGSLGSLEAQIAQTRAKITEAQEQAIQLTESRRVAAGNDLNQINASLNQQQMRRVTASDSRDRSDVRAPYAGTVEKIAFAAAGDVIRPAEPIMEIVPDHDAMVVEAMISPVDIDHVHTGDAVRVRLSSFNRAATPELPGRVIYVATDRSENADLKQVYYLVHIAFDPAALAQAHLDLKSGMPAEVHIASGSRSLLSYLMKPLRDQFARAFRDN